MTKRGKILRDTSAGPGLIVVDGQQYPFQLEGTWKSEIPPRPGLTAEVDFAEDGSIRAVTAVAESQLAKEQAEQAMAIAREKGSALVSSAVAKFGMPTLVATGLLIIGWFFLTTVSYNAGFVGKMDFTFWRILSFINASNAMEALSTMSGQAAPASMACSPSWPSPVPSSPISGRTNEPSLLGRSRSSSCCW